jgi:hypothetical protein
MAFPLASILINRERQAGAIPGMARQGTMTPQTMPIPELGTCLLSQGDQGYFSTNFIQIMHGCYPTVSTVSNVSATFGVLPPHSQN